MTSPSPRPHGSPRAPLVCLLPTTTEPPGPQFLSAPATWRSIPSEYPAMVKNCGSFHRMQWFSRTMQARAGLGAISRSIQEAQYAWNPQTRQHSLRRLETDFIFLETMVRVGKDFRWDCRPPAPTIC